MVYGLIVYLQTAFSPYNHKQLNHKLNLTNVLVLISKTNYLRKNIYVYFFYCNGIFFDGLGG